MSLATLDVMPAICRVDTRIVSSARDATSVTIQITSDCPRIRQSTQELTQVSPLEEISLPLTQTNTYKAAAECSVSGACPVPSAILKAIEVPVGLAHPSDVHIQIERG